MQLSLVRFEAADRLKMVKSSGIRRMFSQAKNIPNVISLGLGEPDFSPPPHVVEAVKEALDAGKTHKTHYTPTTGVPEPLEALAKKAKKDYNLTYDPNTERLITVGGTQAIFLAMQALINPGDEVLIPDPGFVCYEPSVYIADGIAVSTPLAESKGFNVDKQAVISHITEKSRMIIINSPTIQRGQFYLMTICRAWQRLQWSVICL